jgi:ABC-type oligopeptide transport system substrate-binding subunit
MKLALISILAVASLSLTACGEDKKPEPTKPTGTTAPTGAAPTAKASAAPAGW